jgi:hypothetical protein
MMNYTRGIQSREFQHQPKALMDRSDCKVTYLFMDVPLLLFLLAKPYFLRRPYGSIPKRRQKKGDGCSSSLRYTENRTVLFVVFVRKKGKKFPIITNVPFFFCRDCLRGRSRSDLRFLPLRRPIWDKKLERRLHSPGFCANLNTSPGSNRDFLSSLFGKRDMPEKTQIVISWIYCS